MCRHHAAPMLVLCWTVRAPSHIVRALVGSAPATSARLPRGAGAVLLEGHGRADVDVDQHAHAKLCVHHCARVPTCADAMLREEDTLLRQLVDARIQRRGPLRL